MRDAVCYTRKTLQVKGDLLDLSTPLVMGILNNTPDSFYDGGKYNNLKSISERAEKMLIEGATFLDIGGYSTRPNAEDISVKEELSRVLPVIKEINRLFPQSYISIDTFRAEVAKAAVQEGACIINDISGGQLDEKMFATVSQLQVPYILMHSRGTPQTMSQMTSYNHILEDLIFYFQDRLHTLKQLSCKDIIVDLGFGFAKTIEQNHFLLHHLPYFKVLNCPILVGVSRKSMIFKKLGIGSQEALNGTTALHALAVKNGASILRVHDVKEAIEVIKLLNLSNS
ncbi:dihydropteroate synthase [Thermoflexibacter ruber]|uniref:Dihydropteroate synthase n=1 Tax=Thermoflexibacter ruber TaxID=1003 RepID=A0A1I2EA29_9BACT|nr:dihydropteroate synthase [Thermoflexibacter ruber]SFE89456.1 dihydropteroate synthase [Thermoflexibacter ruber]